MSNFTNGLQAEAQAPRRTAAKLIDDAARALYDACPTPKPRWDQLGDTTKSVWRERAEAGFTPTPVAHKVTQN